MLIRSIAAVILCIVFAGCEDTTAEASPSKSAGPSIGQVKLTDLDGVPVDLKQYQGKTIFLHFWATWCKPCIREMPSIAEAEKILQQDDVVFLLASGESAEEVQAFISQRDEKLRYVRIENSEEMHLQALPATFIFNRRGNLVFSESGVRKWNEKENIAWIRKMAQQ